MTTGLDIAVLRSGALLVPVLFAAVLWLAAPRERVGAALATLWNAVTLTGLNVLAVTCGWWSFGTEGLMWAGVPIDVIVGWALLWGAIPVLLVPWVNPAVSMAVLIVADVLAMGGLAPLVQLQHGWWYGEIVMVAVTLLPGVILGVATARGRWLWVRVGLQVMLFGAVLGIGIPAATFTLTGTRWDDVRDRLGGPFDSVVLQVAILVVIVALRAVADIARHGGTPFPWDPPARLVTSGPYAFVANPMQVCAVTLLLLGAAATEVWGLVLAAAVGAVFGAGIAGWHERGQLVSRFGDPWVAYRRSVRDWVPRMRPYRDRTPARLYNAVSCDPCSELGGWLQRRAPVALQMVPAEQRPDALRRIRYESDVDESDVVVLDGTRALGAALEHLGLGWALLGWVMRAPVAGWAVQLLADGVGAAPRSLER